MSKKKYLWAGLLVVLVVAVFLFATSFLKEDPVAFTPSITDTVGEEITGSIAVIETVVLGGVEQTITIRGTDASNPVFLFLHGGPGMQSSRWAI